MRDMAPVFQEFSLNRGQILPPTSRGQNDNRCAVATHTGNCARSGTVTGIAVAAISGFEVDVPGVSVEVDTAAVEEALFEFLAAALDAGFPAAVPGLASGGDSV